MILADLPPEESRALDEAAREVGLAMVYLIAPNTPDERIRAIDERATGFVYAVSVTGLTGSQLPDHTAVEATCSGPAARSGVIPCWWGLGSNRTKTPGA